MAEYSRVVTFEADGAAIDAIAQRDQLLRWAAPRVNANDHRPRRPVGRKVVVAVRFPSEDDLKAGAATFEAMSPPEVGTIRRVSVDQYEVLLERDA